MSRSLSPLLSLVVAATVSSPGVCMAHFPWLVVDDAGHALLFFSEGPAERDYHLPESVAAAKVVAISKNGQLQPIELTEIDEEEFIGRKSENMFPATSALATSFQYGVYSGTLLNYYAKYVPAGNPPVANAQKERPKLDADVRKTDGGIELTVLWQGKPWEGASVTMLVDGKEAQEAKSNSDGKATFDKPGDGLVGFVIGHIVKNLTGELDGESYEGEWHYATVTFDNGPQPAGKKPAEVQSALTPLPEGVASFGATVCDGWLYVYSGHTGAAHDHSRDNLSKHFRRIRLDGQGDWEELPMEAPLQGLPLVSYNGKLFRLGGLDARNAPSDDDDLHSVPVFCSYDPGTATWQDLPKLPEPRSSHDAVVIDGKIYVVGGWTLNGDGEGKWLNTAWVFDLCQSSGEWQPLPSPPFLRRALATAEWNGKLVVLGGIDEDGSVSGRVDCFDPATGQWTQLADFPSGEMAGFGMSAWNLASELYASGAEGELLRLADDGQSWQHVAELQLPRFFHRLLPAEDDSLLVVAGASLEAGHVGTIEKITVGSSH